jgi:hypothetical protein
MHREDERVPARIVVAPDYRKRVELEDLVSALQ